MWWNEEVKDAVKFKTRLLRILVKERTPEAIASYIEARNDSERIKRLSKKNILEQSVSRDTKILIYNIANSYRKGKKERPYSIKAKESDDIPTVQGEKAIWISKHNIMFSCMRNPMLYVKLLSDNW